MGKGVIASFETIKFLLLQLLIRIKYRFDFVANDFNAEKYYFLEIF